MSHWHFYFESDGAVMALGNNKPFGPFSTRDEALDELDAEMGGASDYYNNFGYLLRECDGTHCLSTTVATCRCGWNGEGIHLCHHCGKSPGIRRIYIPNFKFSLAGAQPKFSASDTHGCDDCWVAFSKLLADNPSR